MEIPLEKMKEYADEFIAHLPKNLEQHAHAVGLVGELGAGKTTFVQHVAHSLGVKEHVTSPTFVIAQRYKTEHPFFTELIHIDAYRLENEEKDTIRFHEYMKNPHNLIFVEWPEYLPGGFPENAPTLNFSVIDENTRSITYA